MPIVDRLVGVYKLWHQFVPDFLKTSKQTLGAKIDNLFISVLENIAVARYLEKDKKLPILLKAITHLDLLKFFLLVSWEIKLLEQKRYILLSEQLHEIGRLLGGWRKGLESKTPPK